MNKERSEGFRLIARVKNGQTPHGSAELSRIPRTFNEDIERDMKATFRTLESQHASSPNTESSSDNFDSDDAEFSSKEHKKQQQAPPSHDKDTLQDHSSGPEATMVFKAVLPSNPIWSSWPFTQYRADTANIESPKGVEGHEKPASEDEDVLDADGDSSSVSNKDREATQSRVDFDSVNEGFSSAGEAIPLISDEGFRDSVAIGGPKSEAVEASLEDSSEVQQDSHPSTNDQTDEVLPAQALKLDEPAANPSDENASGTTYNALGQLGIFKNIYNKLEGANSDPIDPDAREELEASQELPPQNPEYISSWLENVPLKSNSTVNRLPEDPSRGIGESDESLYENAQPLPLTDQPTSEHSEEYVEEIDILYDSFGPYSRKHSEQRPQAIAPGDNELIPSAKKSPATLSTSSEEFPMRNKRMLTPPSQPRLAVRVPSAEGDWDPSRDIPNIVSDGSSSDETSDDETASDMIKVQSQKHASHQLEYSDDETIEVKRQSDIDSMISENLDKLRDNGLFKEKRQDVVESYWPDFGENQYISPEQFHFYKAKWDEATHRSNAITFDIMAKLEVEKRGRKRERVRRKHVEKNLQNLKMTIPSEQPNQAPLDQGQPSQEQPNQKQLNQAQPSQGQLNKGQPNPGQPNPRQPISVTALNKNRDPPDTPKVYEDENDRPQSQKGKFLYNNFDDKVSELIVKVLLLRTQFAIDNKDFKIAENIAIEAKNTARRLSYKPLEARAWFWKGQAELGRASYLNACESFQKAKPCIGVYSEGTEVLGGIEVAEKKLKRTQRRLTDMSLRFNTPDSSFPATPMEPGSAINTTNNLLSQMSEMSFDGYRSSRSATPSRVGSASNVSLPQRVSVRPRFSTPSSNAQAPMAPRFSSPSSNVNPTQKGSQPLRQKSWLSAVRDQDAGRGRPRPISSPVPAFNQKNNNINQLQ
ncbi:MAG: hypothetical protein M1836_003590 [Candelina mexicana]|nr:MAG: hypothetical protein M1836_003590 [Candelina mexicana]